MSILYFLEILNVITRHNYYKSMQVQDYHKTSNFDQQKHGDHMFIADVPQLQLHSGAQGEEPRSTDLDEKKPWEPLKKTESLVEVVVFCFFFLR